MNALARYWQARAVNQDELGDRVYPVEASWSIILSNQVKAANEQAATAVRLAEIAGSRSRCVSVYGMHVPENPAAPDRCGICGKRVIW